jgi:hypothetical protein
MTPLTFFYPEKTVALDFVDFDDEPAKTPECISKEGHTEPTREEVKHHPIPLDIVWIQATVADAAIRDT